MIAVIEREIVDKRNWVDKMEFLDLLAISQSAPGILAINISIFIGKRLKGVGGSVVAALGTALPSFVIILFIAMFFTSFKENELIEKAFKGIRPVVIALIAVPVVSLAKAAKLNKYTSMIPVASVILIVLGGLSPVWLIVTGATLGVLYFSITSKKQLR